MGVKKPKYKKINKEVIEEIGNRIVELCKAKGWGDTSVYFNGKRVSIEYDGETIVKEDCHPGNYFDYYCHNHILSMAFEGTLYSLINGYGEAKALDKLLKEYGLYYELGNSWNLSVAPISEDIEVDGYRYEKEQEPTVIYAHCNNNPEPLQRIMNEWWDLSEKTGDVGSCVIGAGFRFTWNGIPYFMCACSPWQGSCSWEPHVDTVRGRLEEIGATEIKYDWGVMD